MTYVITDTCVGACDTSCVDVCPADCIHGPVALDEVRDVPHAERASRFPTLQLYIDPESCIDCGACEAQCPVFAIHEEHDVPEAQRGAVAANAAFFGRGP